MSNSFLPGGWQDGSRHYNRRVLAICSSWPLGGRFGGQMRSLYTAKALRSVGPVSIVMVGADAGNCDARACTEAEFRVDAAITPNLEPNRTISAKLRWALDTRYLNVHGAVARKESRAFLEGMLPHYDLVWVMNARTPNLLQKWAWPNAHLDLDDIPSTYQQATARNGETILGRAKAKMLQYLMRRREVGWKERFSTLSVCSEDDRRYLGSWDQIHVIPNGFERPPLEPVRSPAAEPPRIGFIGLYDYEPNREGVCWFLEKCWPAVEAAVPGVRLRLVGKGTDGPDGPKGADVDALGFVNDSAAEIATWSAMVIPLRLGGGTRIKIADAFSRKCPVVSTSLGAYGYGVEDGKQLRLADTPVQFAAACIDVIRNRAEADAMAERAYQEFLEKWTWDAIAPRVWAAAEDCLRRSRDQGRGSRAIS